MWKDYFKVVKIIPGIVIVPGYGKIDFSSDNVPIELCVKLIESDFIYLEITPAGRDFIYGKPLKISSSKVKTKKPLNR